MLRVPSITPRSGHALIALLLVVKLGLLIWNAAVFDGRGYDTEYHADRALFGGLKASETTHDGPAYYLPTLLLTRPDDVPRVERSTGGEEGQAVEAPSARLPRLAGAEKAFRAELLDFLRYTNVIWLGVFYVVWVYRLFPRLLPGFQPWFLASLLLLALPGYQRLGVAPHPDNMFAGTAALALAAWLWVRERWQRAQAEPRAAQLRGLDLLLFALAIGVMMATRSFAIVPAAVLTIVGIVYAVRSASGDWVKFGPRLLAVVAVVSVLGFSWYSHVRKASHEPGHGFTASYFPKFDQKHEGFDYARYYTTFHAGPLLDSSKGASADSSVVNSFLTLIYSETWGDQWSTFANPKSSKDWPKRVLLGCALAVPPLVFALGVMALWSLVRRVRSRTSEPDESGGAQRLRQLLADLEPELVLWSIVLLGAATFVYWQGKWALFPGDNSTIKFAYIATLFPPTIALLFGRELRPGLFKLLSGYFLVLYIVAFPVAMYWPR